MVHGPWSKVNVIPTKEGAHKSKYSIKNTLIPRQHRLGFLLCALCKHFAFFAVKNFAPLCAFESWWQLA
jgi:hypothetical protein